MHEALPVVGARSVACKTYNVICRSLSEIWVIVWPRRYATLPYRHDANAMHSPILLLCHASVLCNSGFRMPDIRYWLCDAHRRVNHNILAVHLDIALDIPSWEHDNNRKRWRNFSNLKNIFPPSSRSYRQSQNNESYHIRGESRGTS